jgi:hypothetical protein
MIVAKSAKFSANPILVTSYALPATADFVGFSVHFLSFLQNSLLRDAIPFVL